MNDGRRYGPGGQPPPPPLRLVRSDSGLYVPPSDDLKPTPLSLAELVQRAPTMGAKIGLISAWQMMDKPIPLRPERRLS